jgi:hypothetical protein
MSVGFFTQGVTFALPHPPIPFRIILLINQVLDRAWELLGEFPPVGFDFKTADEDLITAKLCEIIENRLRKNGEVPGFDAKLFGKVSRDSKVISHDGAHLDKMPDIHFDLKREDLPVLGSYDGIFVECKPVDKTHPVLSCYCGKGLVRFVNGDYAWAMQEALMIGYAKCEYNLSELKMNLLKEDQMKYLHVIGCHPVAKTDFYESIHNRQFKWMDSCGQACPIRIYHIWKSRP